MTDTTDTTTTRTTANGVKIGSPSLPGSIGSFPAAPEVVAKVMAKVKRDDADGEEDRSELKRRNAMLSTLDQIGVGSLVMVGTPSRADWDAGFKGEGVHIIHEMRGDDVVVGDHPDDLFHVYDIVEHLAGVRIVEVLPNAASFFDRWQTVNPADDSILVAMAAELMPLAEEASRRWKTVVATREWHDASVKLATGKARYYDNEGKDCAGYAEWREALRAYSVVGDRAALLLQAVNWCRPHTLQGIAAKSIGLYFELTQDGGVGVIESAESWEGRMVSQLMHDVCDAADRYNPIRPTGTLEALIEAHKVAWAAFGDTTDAEDEAQDALEALSSKDPILTPARIVGGKIPVYVEVYGEDADADVKRIADEHDSWLRDCGVGYLEKSFPKEADRIRQAVAASLTECTAVYYREAARKLEQRRAPFQPAIDAFNAANDAEVETLRAVVRYVPQSVAEVAAQAGYLTTLGVTDSYEEYLSALAAIGNGLEQAA
jgi:hypothetical protein